MGPRLRGTHVAAAMWKIGNGPAISARRGRAARRPGEPRPPSGPSALARNGPARSGPGAARPGRNGAAFPCARRCRACPRRGSESRSRASRLNHLTWARSSPLVGVTVTWVRGGGICAGWIAVDSSIDTTRKACKPFGRCCTSHDYPRAFVGGLEAVAAQAGHVQQHVRHAVVGNDEAEALGDIEPLDDTGNLNEVGTRFIDELSDRSRPETCSRHFRFNPVRRHDAARRRFSGASSRALQRICRIEDNTGLHAAKCKMGLHTGLYTAQRRANQFAMNGPSTSPMSCAPPDRRCRRTRSARD